MGVSDSKFRVSRLITRNRSRISDLVRIGLGIGLEFLTFLVSDSISGLENRDSGNSGG